MARIKKIEHIDPATGEEYHPYQLAYWCLGCGYEHVFSDKVHKFNGDYENPTIEPSLLLSNPQQHRTCHSFIKGGKIQYLTDCWHHLAGQTVELPDVDEKINERERNFKNKK